MVKLFDKETDAALGEITDEQFAFLAEQLEEESSDDTDYYLNRVTLEVFNEQGADKALMDLLYKALGERDEMEIRWTQE